MVSDIPTQEQARCPRCRFAYDLVSIVPFGITFICAGCEWTLNLATPAVSTPAVPATTVVQNNTTGTPVAVTFSGGTVTGINVNGVSTGQTTGLVIVPVGGNVAWIGSGAPTWTWALPVTNGALTLLSTALPIAAWGTSFTLGQFLMIDTGINSEVVQVLGTPTATSIPVGAGIAATHLTAVPIGICTPIPTYPSVQAVPVNAY
jgi:hypothetical protein